MLEPGSYRIRIVSLEITEDNQMYLEIRLGHPPGGHMMIPLGHQPMTDEERQEYDERVTLEDAASGLVFLKYGQDTAEGFIDDQPEDWFRAYAYMSEDIVTNVVVDRGGIIDAVEEWLRKKGV